MANYASLKNIIDQYITTNGQGNITGAILNDVLKRIINSIGADFLFGGFVEPSSNVGSPDQNVFYIATQGGTYTNFGNVVIPNGITVFKWNGSWANQILFAGDGGVFDITAYNNNTKYANLTAALGTDGANVPQYLRKGGMSVKFVQSSDDQYEQYLLKSDNWSTDYADWVPIKGLVNPIANIRIGENTYRGSLTDMNDAEDNQYYMIQVGPNKKDTIANLPDEMPADGLWWYALTLSFKGIGDQDSKTQYIFKNDCSSIFRRQKDNTTWYPWERILDVSGYELINPIANIRVGDINRGSLTDMNDANDNQYYMIQVGPNKKDTIANLPNDMPADGFWWYALTLSCKGDGDHDSKTQYIFKNDCSSIFRRQKDNTTWYPWERILDVSGLSQRRTIVVAIDGSGDYTKFTDALANAYSRENTDIIVRNGTYDITQEINIEAAGSGPLIGNGTRIYCESDVLILCEYTGSNSSTKSTFSVLTAGTGDYEIHDLNIKCKNIRYCVHDERGTNTEPYNHKYINCHMELDNSENWWDSPQCIGGGLGCYGIIEVDGGYYKGLPHVGDNHYGEISYHNTSAASGKSKITIKNVYFANNTFRAGYHGTNTKITDCFVNGCSMAAQPTVRAEESADVTVNMVLYAWGNEVRSNV